MTPPHTEQKVFLLPLAALVLCAVVGLFILTVPPNGGLWGTVLLLAFLGGALGLARARAKVAETEIRNRSLERAVHELEARALRERETLDSLADGLDVWILVVDKDGTIQYANERFCQVFGYEDPTGQKTLAVTLSRDLSALVEEAASGSRPGEREVEFHHPSDRVGLARVWPETARRERLFVSVYDITGLKRLERARRDFVANVSHELRTPMATIRAMAETILDEPGATQAETFRYLQKIVSEVDRLTHISDDLLTLSAAESRPGTKEPIDLSETARAVFQQIQPKAKRKGLECHFECPGPVRVSANAEQVTQVLLNLLDNAVNYTPTGSVRLHVTSDDKEARVEVVDTGIGVSSEHRPRVFERFYRVDKARSRATGGTGLGLSIVRHIVESHGGKVGLESQLNEGSTFWFTLPLAES